ncbi:MAG: polymer-forming cytoskeletal protein [Longimicrobiales bacterium]
MSMFGQKENETPQQTATPPTKRNESTQDISATRLLTVSGDYAKIEGTFEIADSLEVECEIGGELNVRGKLTIGQNGAVNANVRTVDAVIKGTYEGNMIATGNVEIAATGQVTGNITTDSLVISKGGFFNGNVSRIKEEDKKDNRLLFEEEQKSTPTTPTPTPTPSAGSTPKPTGTDTGKKDEGKEDKGDDDGPGELERVVQSTRNV